MSNSGIVTTVDDDLSQLASSRLSISQTKEVTKMINDSDFVMPRNLHSGLYQNTTTLGDNNGDGDSNMITTTPFNSKNQDTTQIIDADYEFQLCKEEATFKGWAPVALLMSATRRPISSSTSSAPVLKNNGSDDDKVQGNDDVPGFPDFPTCWSGAEGWAEWKRNPSNKCKKSKQPEHRLMRLKRQAVNCSGLGLGIGGSGGRKQNKNNKNWKPSKPKVHKTERRRKLRQQLRQKQQIAALNKSLKRLSCS